MIPDWLSGYRITGTWDEHIARGSTGGVDFGTPVGTPIYALTDCKVTFFYYGDGSSVIRQTRADGTKTEFLHGHLVGSPRAAYPGELVGTTDGRPGADGAGPSNGAHLHVHDITADGVRVYPFSTIGSELASLPGMTPITTPTTDTNPLEDDMTRPPFFRKTAGPIANSMYLIILDTDTMVAIEIDGRTATGQNEIASFQNQQGQYFDKSGQGIAYAPMTLAPATYDAIRAGCKVITPAYPPFK